MNKGLTDIVTRHQVLLERYKSGRAKDYGALAKKFEAELIGEANKLGVDSLNQLTKKQFATFSSNVNTLTQLNQNQAVSTLRSDLSELARSEALFETNTLNRVITSEDIVAKSVAGKAFAAALATPLSANGQLLDPFMKNWSDTAKNQVNGVIRNGYKEGLTLGQLTQRIRGTQAANFKDGLTTLKTRQAEAVIRTSVQHVSSSARQLTWEENSDIVKGKKWVATLDGKTTQVCRGLDGREFPLDSGPTPPIHINCRSTTVPILDKKLGLDFLDEGATRSALKGPVPANQTYYDWLKKQPREFQNTAIGTGKARLLNSGQLTSDQFAKLSLSKTFKPLTLAEMEAKRDLVTKGTLQASAGAAGRPKSGSKTGAIWDTADELEIELGRLPTKPELVERLAGRGFNASTVSVQYGKWRKVTLAEQATASSALSTGEKIAELTRASALRPKSGKTAAVWDLADDYAIKYGKIPSRQEFLAIATSEGINASTAGTQFSKWKKVASGQPDIPVPVVPKVTKLTDKERRLKSILSEAEALGTKDELYVTSQFKDQWTPKQKQARKDLHYFISQSADQKNKAVVKVTPFGELPNRWVNSKGQKMTYEKVAPQDAKRLRAGVDWFNDITSGTVRAPGDVPGLPDTSRKIFLYKEYVNGRPQKRAHFSEERWGINNWDMNFSTTLHEMAHSIEYNRPDILDKNDAWLQKRRTKPDGKKERYTNRGGNGKCFDDEWGERGGHFYTSRRYLWQGEVDATEVLSMGIERMYANPVKFFYDDPDHFEVTLKGLLDLW